MDYSHVAIGSDSLGAVRVDIYWTPGEGGMDLVVRDPETLVEYGVWRALAVLPYNPEPGIFHGVIRSVLGAWGFPELTLWAAYAYGVARRNGFTWVPEKLAPRAS